MLSRKTAIVEDFLAASFHSSSNYPTLNMFSSFFRGARTSTNVSNDAGKLKADAGSDDEAGSEDSNDALLSIELAVEVGGGKGWPENVTVLLYHRIQGLICVGTEGGSIYIFGDGFQCMRPWLTNDPNEVVSLVAVHPNKILAAFTDNSIVVMELPSLNVIDLFQPNWLNPKLGDITAIHSDLPGEKSFVFVGTSEGSVQILDIMESAIRHCDYSLSLSDFGLSGQGFSVTDIHVCPKDEKYLAVALDGGSGDSGAVVVFDLSKSKVYKSFKVYGVTSIGWHHGGEILYAGTMGGEVHMMNVEKGTSSAMWNASGEVINEDEEGHNHVAVRRISWIGPQPPSTEGCLFLLLSNAGADNDNLQNVVMGLSPEGTHGEMKVVFSLPPLHYEKIIAYRVVPTYTKGEEQEEGKSNVVPGLLLLTSKQHEDDRSRHDRKLRIIRCPSVPMIDWALEIGALPDPRMANEVLPAVSEVTYVTGIVPDYTNPLSLGKALVEKIIHDEGKVIQTTLSEKAPTAEEVIVVMNEKQSNSRASRRLSARAFFEHQANSLKDLEMHLQEHDNWEMVLACGQHEEHAQGEGWRNQDVVFVGHGDGTIVGYGVSLPEGTQEVGRGNIWLPLFVHRCSTTAVTCIKADEVCGLLAVGDEAGFFVLFELRDVEANIGAVDLLMQVHERLSTEADILSADEKLANLSDFHEEQVVKQFMMYDQYHFNSVKEVYRTKLSSKVTSTLVLGSLLKVIIGTEDGTVYICSDLKSSNLVAVDTGDGSGEHGSVLALEYSYIPIGLQLQAVVFVYFQDGRLVAIDILTNKLILYCSALKVADSSQDEEHNVTGICILKSDHSLCPKPTSEAVLYASSRGAKNAKNTVNTVDSSSDAVIPSPVATTSPEPVEAPKRRTFFGASRAITPKASQQLATTPPPPEKVPVESNPPNVVRNIDFDPSDIPTKLCIVHNNYLVTFDLKRIGDINISRKRDSMAQLAEMIAATSVKQICSIPIKATNNLLFSSEVELNREDISSWSHYLGCVDNEGCLRIISTSIKKTICHSNLLEGVAEESSVALTTAALLPNGSAYMVHKGSMIYSASVTSPESFLKYRAPDKASPYSSRVDSSLYLAHGREQIIAQTKAAVKKRRSSVITLTSGPTDLYKIFAKTKDQRQKDELLDGRKDEEDEASTGNARRSQRTVSKMNHNEMAQIRENFVERGEKINRIALKMDNFKNNAKEFREIAAAKKEQLAKKNARWGLF